ncbi:DUF3732 domain-containing protein [Vibrio sp. ZF57]|uniref:DUF3732 domain-containing protein n=1 Tax=Vibrio sp. ZF57 TaxID=1840084 RepID=UPI00080E375D|nr:DUF3732 domain-containing protein [Vibrio sp. ZF57]OCH56554.1 hypothetical protein A6D97_00105 [Vibrio sp. ZF57]
MMAKIDTIGVIDKLGLSHKVKLEKGLNVITGRSSTGKSALLEIFDYCFGCSEFNIPEGIITKNTQIYFVLMNMGSVDLLLARENNSTYAFIKEFEKGYFKENEFSIKDFSKKNFILLKEFKSELNSYFGLDITDTDLDENSSFYRGKKKPSPSVRSYMSYWLQHQNLVANKHAVFYRFDEKEKREQAIDHFKIFLGLVDQEYFLISRELDSLKNSLKQLEKVAPRKDALRLQYKDKIRNLFEQYEALTGSPIEQATVDKVYKNPQKWIEKLSDIEITLDSSSSSNSKIISEKEKYRNELLCLLRKDEKEYRDLCSSILATGDYNNTISSNGIPIEVNEHVTKCPICLSESDVLEDESNALGDAIDWLNSELVKTPYVRKSFLSKREKIIKVIREKKGKLKDLDKQISDIEALNSELKNRNSLIEQTTKIKLKIEAQLEILIDITPDKELVEDISKLRKKIKEKKKKLDAYKIESKMKDVEDFINETMNFIGNKLDFEKDYQPINLKFCPTTFDIWYEPIDQSNKKIYLRSMGSGANWLYTHLALFLSLQGLFCKYSDSSLISPILFLDQPTQVYFPNVTSDTQDTFNPESMSVKNPESNRTFDDDIGSVVKFFDEIVTFCEKMEVDHSVMPQIIITDHADNLKLSNDRSFEEYVRARWRNRGFIELESSDEEE